MTKAELRKEFLQKRLSMSEENFVFRSKQIADNFLSYVDFQALSVLHTFLPIIKTKEVDTWQIINNIRKQHPHIRISIPKINTETATVESFFLEGREQLKENMWGILEPTYGVPTPVSDLDIIIVPLLAADEEGHRVGYGRGFYDKLLKVCRPETVKIGLSFFPPVERIDDVNDNDQRLSSLITPERAFTF